MRSGRLGRSGIRRGLGAGGVVVLAACLGPRSDPSAFFLLSSPPAEAAGAAVPVSIGLGPVTLPGYLDRPQIVVRLSDDEIALAEADRWAEPLADNLVRTVEENLAKLLPGSSYVSHPWYAADAPEYAVQLDVRRFEADASGVVVLDATWQLSRGDAPVDRRAARLEEQAAGPGRAAAVAAHSRALAALSREIAAALRRAAGR
jgi:uncharacterized lipoprotein YmbA